MISVRKSRTKVPQCGGWGGGKKIKISCHNRNYCAAKSKLRYALDIYTLGTIHECRLIVENSF
jgi:hypothetical protein